MLLVLWSPRVPSVGSLNESDSLREDLSHTWQHGAAHAHQILGTAPRTHPCGTATRKGSKGNEGISGSCVCIKTNGYGLSTSCEVLC